MSENMDHITTGFYSSCLLLCLVMGNGGGEGVKGQTFLYLNLQPLFDWKESFYRIGKYLIEYIL
jgi:hypothetical protein